MKVYVVAIVLVAFVAVSMAEREKRFFRGKDECSDDSDCTGQCCRGYFTKTCEDYIPEGKRCYNVFGCGCEPGTTCKWVSGSGLLGGPARRCAADEEGSGEM